MINNDDIKDNENAIISEFDEEFTLNTFSSDIAIDSILQQIELMGEETENAADLFEIIMQKYKFMKEKYKENESLIEKMDEIVLNNCEKILKEIEEKLDFKITFNEIMLNEDKIHNIHMIYSFFINYIEEGIESLIYNYFKNNIDKFPKKDINKKDLAYTTMKNVIDPKYINQIFYFVENVETLKTTNLVAEDIIELMIENDPSMFVNFWIQKIFIDNLLVDIDYGDNFVKNIIDWSLDISDKIYKIQNKIYKEYTIE